MQLGLDSDEAVPFGSYSRGPRFIPGMRGVESKLMNAYLRATCLISLPGVLSKFASMR
jgi:hypothetical protein